MIKLKIDNQEINAPENSSVLSAARQLGIEIPTMCYVDGLEHFTSCMVCVVENTASGRLLPACSSRVEEGMELCTGSTRVHRARQTSLELLLSEHVGDCEGICRQACPTHMDIPAMLRLVEAGNHREALITVKERMALPAVLGRVCHAPCEKGCRRGNVDQPLSICKIHGSIAEQDLASDSPYVPECKPSTNKRVAVVGAGPAGLSAAYYLQLEGHNCTVFDKHPQPGGSLRRDTSPEELPRIILDSEINIIQQMGAEFRPDTEIGKDIPIETLEKDYDAVILAMGEPPPETWEKPGRFNCTGAKPHKMAVKAAAQGRAVAYQVHRFLETQEITQPQREFMSKLGKLKEGEIQEYLKVMSTPTSSTSTDKSSTDDLSTEAARCLHCECGKSTSCKLRNLASQYQATTKRFNGNGRKKIEKTVYPPGVIYESGKCIKCGTCVRITAKYKEPLGLTFIGRGFEVKIAMPTNGDPNKGLEKAADLCVQACPTGALAASGGQNPFWKKGSGLPKTFT